MNCQQKGLKFTCFCCHSEGTDSFLENEGKWTLMYRGLYRLNCCKKIVCGGCISSQIMCLRDVLDGVCPCCPSAYKGSIFIKPVASARKQCLLILHLVHRIVKLIMIARPLTSTCLQLGVCGRWNEATIRQNRGATSHNERRRRQ